MKSHLLAIAIFFSFGRLLIAQEIAVDTLPNVVLIVIDDMGWNDVGYHGSEIRTPAMDRLAKEGVELNRFYVHPACSPTRSALMTGKAAVRLGFVNPLGKNNVKGLPLSETIMPQYFKEKGYSTNLVGKWHLGRFKKEYWPYNRGFDHFYG
ncbi:MAG: sulfatase-like hydrolase/transferase, partial [Saprospiraceae bacterium]|nr:sulfatase-like hydrolase/transferase [Saprospiraceae bacterium]